MILDRSIDMEKALTALSDKIDNLALSGRNWLTIEHLAEYLGLSVHTIYQYVHKNKIPFHKIPSSTKLVFKRYEIDCWIEGKDPGSDTIASKRANDIWESAK